MKKVNVGLQSLSSFHDTGWPLPLDTQGRGHPHSPFHFGTKSLLPLEHGNDELSPLLFYVIGMITLKEFDASKFYPNLEKTTTKKLMWSKDVKNYVSYLKVDY